MTHRTSPHKFQLTATSTLPSGVVGLSDQQNTTPIHPKGSTTVTDGRRREAREALVLRGVDGVDSLLERLDPDTVIRTCSWWDRQPNAKPGLLVWKLRQGGIQADHAPASKVAVLRAQFDQYVLAHPVGSRLCSHVALAARKWPGDGETCSGQLMVVDAAYPVLEMECSSCGFVATLTPRAMKGGLS